MDTTPRTITPTQWVITALVAAVLIGTGIYAIMRSSPKTDTSDTPAVNTPLTSSPASRNRLVVTDQYPGTVVFITTVEAIQDGFIAIHKDEKGQPGAIIGSVFVEKGIHPAKITLTEATKNGQTYYAIMHVDADGNKIFSPNIDKPALNADGSPVMGIFKARTDISEDKG
jgi:hypothetical protein